MVRTSLVAAVILLAGCPQGRIQKPPSTVADPVARPVADPSGAVAPSLPELRLPRNFVPTSYAARLEIDPRKTEFVGSISIAGIVDQPSSVIWLHGRKLKVARGTATKESSEVALTITARGEDLLEVRAAKPLEAGEWTLMLDYTGELDARSTAGAFKQTIGDASYVYTQLEALYARRVFPCLDEPDNKVPWKLTLDVPAKLVAVANTPMVSEAPIADGKKRVEFAVSKPLPTYLVAFGVGPFEIVDAGKTKGGTPIRIVTLAKRSADAAYAAKTTAKLVELTEEWFGMPYPYEKLDILTIPQTIGFGAMENAGLITFTETLMLFDAKSSKARKHSWIVVAAHEIAHQWFGNLVTMVYWDDIWLNEGFANWLQHKVSAKFDAGWRDELNDLDTRNGALGSDSIVSARQIRQPIKTSDDILNVFDGITYNKGASILNMFEQYLGADVFQLGVREYLTSKAWGNATSTDFAAAISKAAGKDVGPAFASFLEQAGAPEITATLSCSGAPSVALSQKRYLPPGSATPPENTPWIVPVCVAYERGGKRAQACTLLDKPTGTLALDAKTCPRWIMPNVDGRGYYRNTYTPAQIASLRDEGWKLLTWNERRALFFDLTSGAWDGRVPLTLALSLVPKLLTGNDRFTVGPALWLPNSLDEHVPTELRPKYEHWLRATFGPGAAKAGLTPKDSDTLDVEAVRGGLVGTVAWTGRDPKLVDEAVKLADKWRELPQAIRGLVLDIAVDARPDFFDKILRDVISEPDRPKRQEMYDALASVRDPKRQETALGLLLDPKIDIRETLWMLYGYSNEQGRSVAQAFFRANERTILDRLPRDGTTGGFAQLSGLFTSTCKAATRDEVVAYVTKVFAKMPGGERVVKQNIERMDQCIAKTTLIDPEIKAWLGGVKMPKPPRT